MPERTAKPVRVRSAADSKEEPATTPRPGVPGILQRIVDWGMTLFDLGDDEPAPKSVSRHKRPERANATVARVRQVNMTSCGVAAAAMFARQKHAVVKAFMFPTAKRHYGTHYEDVWRALTHFGVEHEEKKRKFKNWDEIPSHALVHIRWLTGKNHHHWVLYQRLTGGRFRVIDPGSWEDTLTLTDLDGCEGIDYSLATPRTREQGPATVAPAAPKPKKRRRTTKRAATKKVARRKSSTA